MRVEIKSPLIMLWLNYGVMSSSVTFIRRLERYVNFLRWQTFFIQINLEEMMAEVKATIEVEHMGALTIDHYIAKFVFGMVTMAMNVVKDLI